MSELKIISPNNTTYQVELDKTGLSGLLNGTSFDWDVVPLKKNRYSIIQASQSYQLEVLEINTVEKSFLIKVNGIKYLMNAKDKYDELLHSLGMDAMAGAKVLDLKAPMPGLVLGIEVAPGQTVQKGDVLLILEAMKMENAIKSPTDGVIKNIAISKGETVEKNQTILNFE